MDDVNVRWKMDSIRTIFVVFFKAEYYSNIQIHCPSISEYWSLKIRGDAGIKEVLFSSQSTLFILPKNCAFYLMQKINALNI